MKPHIASFVKCGLDGLMTNDMKETIKACFKKEGRLQVCRSDLFLAQQLVALSLSTASAAAIVIPDGEEIDNPSNDDMEDDDEEEAIDV